MDIQVHSVGDTLTFQEACDCMIKGGICMNGGVLFSFRDGILQYLSNGNANWYDALLTQDMPVNAWTEVTYTIE